MLITFIQFDPFYIYFISLLGCKLAFMLIVLIQFGLCCIYPWLSL